MQTSRRRRAPALVLAALVLVAPALAPAPAAAKQDERVEKLAERYRAWLESVHFLISEAERELFLGLGEDYQRDAFIEEFWRVRDPYPRSARNEFREDYERRLAYAREELGGVLDDRGRILLINGEPLERMVINCTPHLWPIEVWYYDGSDSVSFEMLLLFYQRWGGGPFKLWEPFDGLEALSRQPDGNVYQTIADRCGRQGEAVLAAISFLGSQGGALGATSLLARIQKPPKAPKGEWVATFGTYTTEVPAEAATFPATLAVDYPGRHQSRTVLQGTLRVPAAGLAVSDLAGYESYDLLLNGEILAGDRLFESFRYRYSFPLAEVGGELPLVFQRYLRPGTYRLLLRLEDTNAGAFHRSETTIEVPESDLPPPPADLDPETARILAEANAAIREGASTLQIAPLRGEWQTGLVRIDALTTGDRLDHVTFFLDGQAILTKKAPPFNVELDLGDVPRARVLRVSGFDAAGEEVASDEVTLNAGRNRFAVRLEEPRKGKRYATSLRAEVDVTLPEGETVERVELYWNESKVATLYQEPWVQPIVLPAGGDEIAYVRAVAYRPDGSSTEDLVFVNAPENLEEIDVDFVELYATVLDRAERPVDDLPASAFAVREDDVPQEILRFEQVRNLPIHVAVMLDVSASMEEELATARDAALTFLDQAITPKDRATVVTFNDHPHLAAKFSNDLQELAAGLAGLKAERGTALYDALVYTLYYFNGVKGQRAVLLLSDGKDESSRFGFDDALEYAHRSGVAVYTIGLQLGRGEDAKRKLDRLAAETGGRSFFVESAAELAPIYEAIQRELRSRYLIAYQSTNTTGSTRFRTVQLTVADSALEPKTMRGYFP